MKTYFPTRFQASDFALPRDWVEREALEALRKLIAQVLLLGNKAPILSFLTTSDHFFQLLSASTSAYSAIRLNLPLCFASFHLISFHSNRSNTLFNLTPRGRRSRRERRAK